MNMETMQAAILVLLAVIAAVAVLSLVSLMRVLAFIRQGRDADLENVQTVGQTSGLVSTLLVG